MLQLLKKSDIRMLKPFNQYNRYAHMANWASRYWEGHNLLSALKYCLAALLIVVPLYPKFPIFNVPGTYVAIRAEDFLISLIALLWLPIMLRRGVKAFLKDKFNQAILIFFAAGLLSSLSSILLTRTAPPHIVFLHWARRIEYIIPFFAALEVVRSINKARFLTSGLFFATFFVFAFGWGQVYANFPVISTQNEEYSKGLALRWVPGARLHSTFAGHYDLAAFLVILLPISAALFWHYKKLKNKIIFLLFSVLPSFWLMLRAESRVSFASFIFGVCVSLWLVKKKVFIIPFIVFCVLSAVLFTNLGVRYRNSLQTYWQRITNSQKINFHLVTPVHAQERLEIPERTRSKQTEDKPQQFPSIFEDRSTAIRLNVEWPRALRAFFKNPLLGTGYSSITLATDNDYLRALGETGLVGTLALLLVILRILQKLITYIKNSSSSWSHVYVCGFTGGMAGLLLNATFIDVFEASKVAIIFWALAGIAVGLIERKNNEA